MISFIIKLIPALLGFGILVFFHELGHFVAAKLFGIKVEAFSIGWGPKLFGFKRKETTYKISAIPIGGYCKFKDEYISDEIPGRIREELFQKILSKLSAESREFLSDLYLKGLPAVILQTEFEELCSKLDNEAVETLKKLYHYNAVEEEYTMLTDKEEEYKLSGQMAELIKAVEVALPKLIKFNLNREKYYADKKRVLKLINSVYNVQKLRDPDSFYGVAPHKRLIVAFAGPLMNFVIAILFLTILAAGTYNEFIIPNKIIVPEETESPAAKGGLQDGDTIVDINGTEIHDFEMIRKYMYLNADGKPLKVTVERGGRLITKTVTPVWNEEMLMYMLGVTYYMSPVIKINGDDSPLESLGMKDRDEIIGINGDYDEITTSKVSEILRTNLDSDENIVFHVKRGTGTIDIEFNLKELIAEVGLNNFYIPYHTPRRLHEGSSPIAALGNAFRESVDNIRMTYIGLYSMLFRPKKNVTKHLGGPIMIGAIIGNVTVAGFENGIIEGLVEFLKIISTISLALAIFNLLPLPAVDGGHIILNIFEMITRHPISMKIIYGINLTGFVLMIGLALFIAFLDISRLIPG